MQKRRHWISVSLQPAMNRDNQFHAFLNITENRSRIMAMIMSMVRDFGVAEDLFQETVLEILKSESRFDPTKNFTPWACGIARNVVRQYWRRQKKEPAGEQADIIAELAMMSTEGEDELWRHERIALRRCLQKLPERMRKLVWLRYGNNYKGQELAERASVRKGSIRTTLARIRTKLRNCIELENLQSQ